MKTDGRGTRIETITMTEDLGTLKLLFQKKFHCHIKTKTKNVACEEMFHLLSSTCSIFHQFCYYSYIAVSFIYFQSFCLYCESSTAILICLQRKENREKECGVEEDKLFHRCQAIQKKHFQIFLEQRKTSKS